ncbi:MAG TPA: hypothetical protein VNK95_03230, partial [Caldilineaceae bacterium]|nr:hypothetical protein [Caldilineaceae bacterium]
MAGSGRKRRPPVADGREGWRLWRATLALAAIVVAAVAGICLPGRVLAAANTDDEIVYRDPNGFLRVVDPRPTSLTLQVSWVSPEGGWVDFALGDFNADGDSEIVAVKPDGDGRGILTVFDPVALNVGDDHDRFVDGVPWDVLYTASLSGPPLLVTTGTFDPSRPGDEIVYSFHVPVEERVNTDDPWRVVVLRQANADAPGREFETLASFDTGVEWTWMAAGDVGGNGIDELALIDEVEGDLSLFRVTGEFERIYRNVSRENTWQAAVFGQYTAGGAEELAAVREERFPLASLLVFRWDGTTLADVVADVLVPGPNYVFLADIGGNGDQEVVMLRRVRQ